MSMKKRYYTVNGEIIGEQTTGQERIDYLTDPLGNVTATIDQNAKVLNRYTYKPFGEVLSKEGSAPDPKFLWVGAHGYRQTGKKYADVYIRKRTYDTSGGRWTSRDPIGYFDGLNSYYYVQSNPVNDRDMMGLSALIGCRVTGLNLSEIKRECKIIKKKSSAGGQDYKILVYKAVKITCRAECPIPGHERANPPGCNFTQTVWSLLQNARGSARIPESGTHPDNPSPECTRGPIFEGATSQATIWRYEMIDAPGFHTQPVDDCWKVRYDAIDFPPAIRADLPIDIALHLETCCDCESKPRCLSWIVRFHVDRNLKCTLDP
jgi:RHS repeat-associated protein